MFYAKHLGPKLKKKLVRYSREFVITVIVITEFDCSHSVFQAFSKAKSANSGSIFSSSQFLKLPQLPQKIKLASKLVQVDSKIIISLPKI